MKFIEKPVRIEPVRIMPVCSCGDVMENIDAASGIVRPTLPPQQQYQCPGCGHTEFGPEGFPRIEWRECN